MISGHEHYGRDIFKKDILILGYFESVIFSPGCFPPF